MIIKPTKEIIARGCNSTKALNSERLKRNELTPDGKRWQLRSLGLSETDIEKTIVEIYGEQEQMDNPPVMMQTLPSAGLFTSGNFLAIQPRENKTVLIITGEGKKMRGDRELSSLSKEELLVVIDDLIDLIRRK